MKRVCMLLLLAAVVGSMAFAQLRLDIGIDVPLRISAIAEGIGVGEGENVPWTLPFPSAGLYYTLDAGPVTIGLGARMYSLILVSLVWPNALVEFDVGPVVLAGQIGGGMFTMFGLATMTEFGKVFIPDLSAWFKIGNTFRVGVGAMGLFLPELETDVLPVVYYLGFKAAIEF